MAALPGLTCPECGRTAKDERSLGRARRRWRWALAGLLAASTSSGWLAYSHGKGGAWRRWLPDTLVILLVPHTHGDEWAVDELRRRLSIDGPSPRAAHGSGLYLWQWRLLAGACSRTLDLHGLPSPRSSAILLCAAPPEASFDRLIALLRDDDQNVRYWAAFGLVNLRRLLTPDQLEHARDAILDASRIERQRTKGTREIQARALQMELDNR
jgi:hypothetical protein